MKRKIGISIILIMVLFSILAIIPIEFTKSQPWMKEVNDDTKIKEMSIPGTHDSGALHSIFDVAGKCQDLSIKGQLNVGVRFFDLRLQLVNDELVIVHSFVDQNLKFEKVLKDITKFIENNNSEFIIISIKKEEADKDSTIDFKEILLGELNKYNDIICHDKVLPETIKEARGKIYILSRYDMGIGIDAYSGWLDSTTFELGDLYIQDNYCIDDVNIKKNDILSTFEYSKGSTDKLVLNFTSGYFDYGFPPTYAGTFANEINPWLLDNLKNNNNNRVGIVIVDFVTKELAEAIYMRNIL